MTLPRLPDGDRGTFSFRPHRLDQARLRAEAGATASSSVAANRRHNPASRPFSFMKRRSAMSSKMTKAFVLAGIVMKRLLSGQPTAGQFCLFENKSDGNTRTPIHV